MYTFHEKFVRGDVLSAFMPLRHRHRRQGVRPTRKQRLRIAPTPSPLSRPRRRLNGHRVTCEFTVLHIPRNAFPVMHRHHSRLASPTYGQDGNH